MDVEIRAVDQADLGSYGAIPTRFEIVEILELGGGAAGSLTVRVESPVVKDYGSALMAAAEAACRDAGLRELKVETQNINVPACRFYARHGFQLRRAVRDAYPELPSEVQLLWYKVLRTSAD